MEKDESYSSFAFKQQNNQTMISHSSKENNGFKEISGVPRLNALRFSRRSALDIFGTFKEGLAGYLEQLKGTRVQR